MFENIIETIKTDRKAQIITAVITTIALITVVAIILSPKKQETAQIPSYPITLTWWKQYYDQSTYKEIIDEFKALPQNKDVEIEIIKKPNTPDYYRNLLQDISRQTGPDIFTIHNDDLPAYQEYLTPLTNVRDENGNYVPDTKLLTDYKENMTDITYQQTVDRGQIYAITSYVENLQLYYNTNLLNQAGIANPATTWDDLIKQLPLLNKRDTNKLNFNQSAISLGTGITKKNGKIDNGGDININRFQELLPLLIFQNGGQIYDTNTDTTLFGAEKIQADTTTAKDLNKDDQNSNPTNQAIKFYESFADVNNSHYSWNGDSNDSITAFVEGRLAYTINYSYLQDIIKNRNPNFKYSIAKLPQLDFENKRTYGFFYMDGVSNALKKAVDTIPLEENLKTFDNKVAERKLQVAKDFMYFLSTRNQQQAFANKTGLASAHKSVIADQTINGDIATRIFAQGALYAQNYYKPDVKRVEQMWGDMVYRTQYENMAIDESIALATTEYGNIIKDKPKLRY